MIVVEDVAFIVGLRYAAEIWTYHRFAAKLPRVPAREK